jgi:hypothetical protein
MARCLPPSRLLLPDFLPITSAASPGYSLKKWEQLKAEEGAKRGWNREEEEE